MKRIILATIVFLLCFTQVSKAHTGGPFTIIDNQSGSKISLWIPGFAVKFGARFMDEDEAIVELVRSIGSISVNVLEGDFYHEKNADWVNRKIDKMNRNGLENLVSVRTGQENIIVKMKTNKRQVIRKLVCLVDDGETFVLVKMNCRIHPGQLAALMAGADHEGPDKIMQIIGQLGFME